MDERTMKQPKPGQRVIVTDVFGMPRSGTVIDCLSKQFTYWQHSTDETEGRLFFCLYNGDWKHEQH